MKIPHFNFLTNLLICILCSAIQLLIIYKSPIVYIPLFFVIIISFAYGLLEPKRGWLLALIQVLLIVAGYWITQSLGFKAVKQDEAQFAAHILIFPSFVASFLASFLFKK